ncbi:sensor domain-containing diguanylate cyclase [Nocardioides sp. Kera G14]|uniref:GGDEF domain-containing protein n=1 Tax=Nocardioides sp. Kera G14 TaxID=2884264 RepID=UPI001D122188|nr:GGDEF domain-containing protein [Nocardioides sp. Kera G14]UDY23778.1 GGDEF domain-containing protein [Nocardioides sp. Kera G14]
MVVLGWLVAALCLLVAALVVVRRRRDVDSVLMVVACLGVACWNVIFGYYAEHPIGCRWSALYLTSISVAMTGWALLARRAVDPTWRPRNPLLALMVAEPLVVLLCGVFLDDPTWGHLFWPKHPLHHEPSGILYEAHCVWGLVLLAVGASALLKRVEQRQAGDERERALAFAALGAALVGVACQVASVRAMPYVAVITGLLVIWMRSRQADDAVSALASVVERDPVTGVMARAGLDAVLRLAVDVARKQAAPLSVMVIDIDDFKAVNDRQGHVVGDVALRHVTSAIRATAGGIVGRFGGDEFVAVLPGIDIVDAHHLAQRVVRAVSRPFEAHGEECRVTVSAGVADYDPETHTTPDALLGLADRAMYTAKRSGGSAAAG